MMMTPTTASSPSSSEDSSPTSIEELPVPPPPVVAIVRHEGRIHKSLSDVTWDDIVEDNDGEACSIIGYDLILLTSNQLRSVCSKLELKGLKNVKKSVMIDAIKTKYKFVKGYSQLDSSKKQQDEAAKPGSTATRKEAQCTFRLVNLLFSDKFAEDFCNTGRTPSRDEIDRGAVANHNLAFWERVRSDFVNEIDEYHLLEIDEEDKPLFAEHGSNIDPGKIVPHSAEKLRDIWKDLNSEYKKAMLRFTTSGEHNSNFYDYCFGKLDTYYMYKQLKKTRPGLNDFVLAELPSTCALSSDDFLDGKSVSSMGANAGSSSNKRRKKEKQVNAAATATGFNILATAIRETSAADSAPPTKSPAEVEFIQQRVSFMIAEDSRKDNEEKRRQNQEERSARTQNLDEWERIRVVIKGINNDLKNPLIDEDEKKELLEEREGLKKRKLQIAEFLGLA